jgi:hypothetical protein
MRANHAFETGLTDNWHRMNFIPLEIFSMGIMAKARVSSSSNWRTTRWFLNYTARQHLPFAKPDWGSMFRSKINRSPSIMGILVGGRSEVSNIWMTSSCWDSDNLGQLHNGLTSRVNVDPITTTELLDFSTVGNRD